MLVSLVFWALALNASAMDLSKAPAASENVIDLRARPIYCKNPRNCGLGHVGECEWGAQKVNSGFCRSDRPTACYVYNEECGNKVQRQACRDRCEQQYEECQVKATCAHPDDAMCMVASRLALNECAQEGQKCLEPCGKL